MGRGLVIITTAMVFIFGIVQMSIVNRHNVETGINIDYATWVQARNFASSGMEMAVKELREDRTWRNSYNTWPLTFDNLPVQVQIDDNSSDANILEGLIRVVSTCTMGNRTATVTALLTEGGGTMLDIIAAIAIYSNTADLKANGKAFQVDGNDALGLADPVYGIGTGNDPVYETVDSVITKSGADQTDNVTGLGDNPSIAEVPNMNEELKILIEFYKANAVILPESPATYKISGTETLGTEESPQITYKESGTVELTGGSNGTGILIIGPNATLAMKGGAGDVANFNGLIIVQGNALIRGTMNVNGAMLFGGNTNYVDLEISGNIAVQYHSGHIQKVRDYLDGLGTESDLPPRLVSVYE